MLEVDGVEMLPQLSHLRISGVPKLSLPPLPSVMFLHSNGRNEELLKSLSDYQCNDDVASFPRGIACNMHHLKKLFIEHFDELKALPDELATFGALEELEISFCNKLESFPEHVLQGLCSLRTLTIWLCPELKSLSEGMEHLTCLERLEILHCPQLVLPSNMNRLTDLRKVRILGENKNGMLEFPSLTSLPDWMGSMTSLQKLEIRMCPKLRSLPDNFQQLRNLHELSIYHCPKLEKRCKKGIGKDWPKIAHVPEFELHAEWTFCEKIISAWKMRNQFLHRHRCYYTSEDEFDSMVDVY